MNDNIYPIQSQPRPSVLPLTLLTQNQFPHQLKSRTRSLGTLEMGQGGHRAWSLSEEALSLSRYVASDQYLGERKGQSPGRQLAQWPFRELQ